MKKDAFVRISGWSLIVGAIVFLPGVSAMMLYDTQYAKDLRSWREVGVFGRATPAQTPTIFS